MLEGEATDDGLGTNLEVIPVFGTRAGVADHVASRRIVSRVAVRDSK